MASHLFFVRHLVLQIIWQLPLIFFATRTQTKYWGATDLYESIIIMLQGALDIYHPLPCHCRCHYAFPLIHCKVNRFIGAIAKGKASFRQGLPCYHMFTWTVSYAFQTKIIYCSSLVFLIGHSEISYKGVKSQCGDRPGPELFNISCLKPKVKLFSGVWTAASCSSSVAITFTSFYIQWRTFKLPVLAVCNFGWVNVRCCLLTSHNSELHCYWPPHFSIPMHFQDLFPTESALAGDECQKVQNWCLLGRNFVV